MHIPRICRILHLNALVPWLHLQIWINWKSKGTISIDSMAKKHKAHFDLNRRCSLVYSSSYKEKENNVIFKLLPFSICFITHSKCEFTVTGHEFREVTRWNINFPSIQERNSMEKRLARLDIPQWIMQHNETSVECCTNSVSCPRWVTWLFYLESQFLPWTMSFIADEYSCSRLVEGLMYHEKFREEASIPLVSVIQVLNLFI